MCSKPAIWKGGPLMWILPLYLHVNKKSDDDDDDDDCNKDFLVHFIIFQLNSFFLYKILHLEILSICTKP